jgi:pimeloyl-ACP methyl ester carboxylesterase
MPILETPGATLAYEIAGSGPPVLLVQGVGMAGEAWQPQVAALVKQHRVLYFDNRGTGKSLPLQGALSIEHMASDARALMDHVGWDAAHVAGHSMGGVIAHQLALDAPERVLSLALLCTFSRGKDAARLTPDIAWMGLRTRIGTRRMRRNAFLELIMPQAYLAGTDRDRLADRLAQLIGRDLADQPAIAMKQLRAMARHDSCDRLSELQRIPTLVVSAAHDRIALPRYSRQLAQAIAAARYMEIEDAGHAVTLQKPDQINGLLIEHFASASASRGA